MVLLFVRRSSAGNGRKQVANMQLNQVLSVATVNYRGQKGPKCKVSLERGVLGYGTTTHATLRFYTAVLGIVFDILLGNAETRS